MTRQIQDAYIVAATRTAVGKAPRGMYKNTRPDDLLAHVLQRRRAVPGAGSAGDRRCHRRLRDARGEQGMNVARIGLLLAGCRTPCRA
jgi:acetyl-CoA acyltransferase